MKKKILSTLLAVAMFASVAVPAFASNTSTQEGDPAKITMLEFRKDGKPLASIDIKEDEEVDLDQYLMAWEDKDTLVLDKNQIVWEIRDTQSVFNMDSEGHIVATEPKGSATVIARDGEKEKVVAKLTVNAKPNNKETYANSWKFGSANYDVIYDNENRSAKSEGLEMKAIPVPAGSIFTDENIEIITEEVKEALASTGLFNKEWTSAGSATSFVVNLGAAGGNVKFGDKNINIAREVTTKASVTVDLSNTANKAQKFIDTVGENAIEFKVNGEAVYATFELVDEKNNKEIRVTLDQYVEGFTEAMAKSLFTADEGSVRIVSLEKGSEASAESREVSREELEAEMAKIDVSVNGDGEIVFKVDKKYLPYDRYKADDIKEGQKFGLTVKTDDFQNKNGNPIKNVTAKTNLITKVAVNTTKVSVLPSKTIEVGETFKLKDTLGWGNSKANVLKGVETWYEAPLNNDAAVSDYAIVEDGVVTGVKTGKNRIYVRSNGGMEAYCTVTVVPKGTIDKVDDHNAVLKVKDVTVTVGGTQWIDLYNIDADSIVKWTSSDEAIAKIVGNSENKGAKVWGLKEGTATLTLTVDGDVAATLNVTVKGAATTPSKPDATGNAQTGDTLFSNLF